MMTQGMPPFQHQPEKSESGLTSFSGLFLYLDLAMVTVKRSERRACERRWRKPTIPTLLRPWIKTPRCVRPPGAAPCTVIKISNPVNRSIRIGMSRETVS